MKYTIICTGDSVTEGMATEGHHFAEYGKSPYPARLNTILTDMGYDVEVLNYGHGGERTPDIAARLGGKLCYFSEDIVINENNDPVSLGKQVLTDGRIRNTKIKICYADGEGEDYCVYFTQTSHDTNPITVDGAEYILSVVNNENFIKKAKPDGKKAVIKAGSALFTANRRYADLSVVYGGINDNKSLTLKRWLDLMESCGSVSGGRYIVLGATHPLWESWSDVKGETPKEKYEYYRRAANERFGVHFIDLYEELSKRWLDIALCAGYFADKTETEKDVMRGKLLEHIVPAEFTYNKQADGNVHLSEEGYHAVAVLIAERAILLGYIRK